MSGASSPHGHGDDASYAETIANRNNSQFFVGLIPVISASALVITVMTFGYGMMQQQIAAIERQLSATDLATKDRVEATGKTDKERLDTLRQETADRREEIRKSIIAIEAELAIRRTEFVNQAEFKSFMKGNDEQISLVIGRLEQIERSRPTTGELKATADALRDRIEKLYLMAQSMEDWMRAQQKGQK